MKIRQVIARMNGATVPAYITLKITLILCCIAMTAAGIGAVIGWDEHIVRELYAMPQSFLLIGGLLSVVIEDISL